MSCIKDGADAQLFGPTLPPVGSIRARRAALAFHLLLEAWKNDRQERIAL